MPKPKYDLLAATWLHPLLGTVVDALTIKLQESTSEMHRGIGEDNYPNLIASQLQKFSSTYDRYHLDAICDFHLGQLLLADSQYRQRLLVLLAPLQISASCPPSLRQDLPIELVEELKSSFQKNYSYPDTRPLELYDHLFKLPLKDKDLEGLHHLLSAIPTVVIYGTITDCRVYIHIAWWFLPDQMIQYLSLRAWDWEDVVEDLLARGIREVQALRVIRHGLWRIYQFVIIVISEWYHSFGHYQQSSYIWVLQEIAPIPQLQSLEIAQSLIREECRQRWLILLKDKLANERYKLNCLTELGKGWKLSQQFSPHRGMIFGVLFCRKDNQLLLAGSQGFLQVISLSSQKELLSLVGHTGDIVSITVSYNHRFFATLGTDRQIKVWHLDSFAEAFSLSIDTLANCLSFSPDNRFLACSGDDGYIYVWDLWTKKLFRQFGIHGQAIYTITFTPDNQFLLTGGKDGYIKVWNLINGHLNKFILAHDQGVLHIKFNPTWQCLVSAGRSGEMKLWTFPNLSVQQSLKGHNRAVSAITFSENGQVIASGGVDGNVYLWDVDSGHQFAHLIRHSHPILCLAFDKNQSLVAGSSWQNNVMVWQHYQ